MATKKKILIILILLAVCFIVKLPSLARYSSNYVWNYYLESHGFYLASDSLGLDKKNVDTFWDGGRVTFNIKNSSNNNLITDYDIGLEVTCEIQGNTPATCKLNGTNASTISLVLSSNSGCTNNGETVALSKSECELNEYTWSIQKTVQDVYFEVVPNQGETVNNVNVKITVRSTSPYRKTITGIFSLYKNSRDTGSITKQINDKELYDELILTNSYNTRKCVLISFDSTTRTVEYSNDMIAPVLDEDSYITGFKIALDALSNKKFTFYNKDFSSNYSADDFTISETTGCF